MKCALCNESFNDGVQCASCKKQLDFRCASISEAGWRKLGADRRAVWKCPSCRISSPSASTTEQASLQVVLNEIRDLKRQLSILPSLTENIHSIKDELKELRNCCEYNSSLVEEFSHKLKDLESRITGLEGLQATVHTLHRDVEGIRAELKANDQRSRLNNVEIKGVPLSKTENLFDIVEKISKKVNFSFPMTQINYISRIPMYKSKEKAIIVSFLNRYIKEDFVAAARVCKTLSTLDLGFNGTSSRIFVNDHLNADSKILLNKTKLLAKQNSYKYVWVKHGKIHIRKDDTSKSFVIINHNDLNKLT
ncbi:uncharacterized protein LOC119189773 [Manduca sexta]|uniref:uncharacterized protein LOC119189773 n=1 Tax=Manduca sexta TaxID=7130 RepID=UPI00188FDE32|nr:uncharacterized protein LOC119189773 [Manduca sexta]